MPERKYDDAKKEIRSVLLTYQSSIALEEFLKTYKSLLGERLPSRALGYHTDVHFLQSMPDVVNVCTDPQGKVSLSGIADQSSEHIQKLVSKQRKPPRNNRSSNQKQRMPNKFHISYREMKFLPANMRAEILKLMEMYHDGVTFSTFALTYRRRFNKYLPLVRGFDSLEDMINLIPELEVKTVNNERLICFANSYQQKRSTTKENIVYSSHQAKSPEQKKITQSSASSSIHQSGISDDILQNFKQLLAKCPGGIIDVHFPLIYENLFQKNFDVLEFGFNSIIELVDSLPHIFKRVLSPDNDKNWIIVPANSPMKDRRDEFKSPLIPHQVVLKTRQGIPADAASPTLQYVPPVMPQNLDLNEYIPVFVSAIINPSLFWFQLQTEDIIKEFEQFEKDLGYFYNNHASSRYVMSDADIAIGATCVVCNKDDSQWYRAVIKSIPNIKFVNVLFVDYGSTENVPRANLHYVRSKYHEYPAHAFKAQLAGLKPSNNASLWSIKATHRFIKLCECISLMAYLTSVDKDTFSAYLCDTSGESDVHLNDVLVKQGFGEFCFENHFVVDNNNAPNTLKEANRSDSDCYFSSESMKQNQSVSSEKEQNNSFVASEVSHARRKLIFSPKAQVNGIEPKFSSKENGHTARRFVKLVQLCEDSKIYVINVENRLFTSRADLSRLLWNDRDSSYLTERLKYKEVTIPFLKVAKDDYSSLFEQCIWFKVPEYEKLESSNSFLIMYSLDCALQILNVFGHPSICLRLAIQNEIKSFSPSDPVWKEFNCDKLDELSLVEKEIMDELNKLCLYDLKAKYEALKIKRIRQERMQNSPTSIEIKKIENLQRVVERRMKEIEAICLQFPSPS